MSELYVIVAYDYIFNGADNFIDYEVVEGLSEEDLEDYADIASYRMINHNIEILHILENRAARNGYEEGTEEWATYIEASIEDDIAYKILKITKETKASLDTLNDKIYKNPKAFIKEYCLVP